MEICRRNHIMTKSLKDISWQVTEEEYRADKALSYSTLAKFKRSGFNELDHLFDKVESPSLTFGSAVDSIITGGEKEFNERFTIAEFPTLSDSLIQITKSLFEKYKDEAFIDFKDIPDTILAQVGKECNFYAGDKYVNYRVKLIRDNCKNYYNLLFLAKGKTILNSQEYQNVCNAVQALRSSQATKWYFEADTPFDNIERLYQLKFKHTFNGVNYRCMADLLVVDHDKKIVIPVDLKTSGKPEWDFHKSFLDWDYMIQARLYWRIIRACMDEDPYFKNFVLDDYRFIVVNKYKLTPLVWKYEDTTKVGTLTYGKNHTFECRDPFDIGKELNEYLKHNCSVPREIEIEKLNSLTYWLNKL